MGRSALRLASLILVVAAVSAPPARAGEPVGPAFRQEYAKFHGSERVLAMQWHIGRLQLAGPSELAVGASPQTRDQLVTRLAGDDAIFINGYK